MAPPVITAQGRGLPNGWSELLGTSEAVDIASTSFANIWELETQDHFFKLPGLLPLDYLRVLQSPKQNTSLAIVQSGEGLLFHTYDVVRVFSPTPTHAASGAANYFNNAAYPVLDSRNKLDRTARFVSDPNRGPFWDVNHVLQSSIDLFLASHDAREAKLTLLGENTCTDKQVEESGGDQAACDTNMRSTSSDGDYAASLQPGYDGESGSGSGGSLHVDAQTRLGNGAVRTAHANNLGRYGLDVYDLTYHTLRYDGKISPWSATVPAVVIADFAVNRPLTVGDGFERGTIAVVAASGSLSNANNPVTSTATRGNLVTLGAAFDTADIMQDFKVSQETSVYRAASTWSEVGNSVGGVATGFNCGMGLAFGTTPGERYFALGEGGAAFMIQSAEAIANHDDRAAASIGIGLGSAAVTCLATYGIAKFVRNH